MGLGAGEGMGGGVCANSACGNFQVTAVPTDHPCYAPEMFYKLPARKNFRYVFLLLLLQAYNINWQNTEYKLHYHKIKTFKQYSKKDFRQKLATNSTKITHQHKA